MSTWLIAWVLVYVNVCKGLAKLWNKDACNSKLYMVKYIEVDSFTHLYIFVLLARFCWFVCISLVHVYLQHDWLQVVLSQKFDMMIYLFYCVTCVSWLIHMDQFSTICLSVRHTRVGWLKQTTPVYCNALVSCIVVFKLFLVQNYYYGFI